MKALTRLNKFFLITCASAFFALSACAPVGQDAGHASGQPATSTFADALAPPGGVPCRFKRPNYTALQRQLGIRGSVHVTYVVNTVGRIDLAIVDKSSGNQELDNAARDSVVQGTCAPYIADGVAHRVVQNTTFTFGPALTVKPARQEAAQTVIDSSSAVTPNHLSQQAAPANPVSRATPATSVPSAAVALPSSSTTAPQSLEQAIQAAILQRMGIAPDSARAALIKHWGERMRDDPDVSRLLGNGPNHGSVFSLSPSLRAQFFADAVLRMSPEDRSKLLEITSKALDNAPADCGGVKNAAIVMQRYMPLASMSDAEIDAYFGVTFAMFKQSALQAPVAHVTEEQRAQALHAVLNTLKDMLKNDAEGTRDVAAAVADPAGVSPEVWCKNARLYNRAVLATPQPLRDWSIVAADTDAKARINSLGEIGMPGATQPSLAPQDYATQVQRRVRPNVIWAGPVLDSETAITVHCLPNGTLLSATVTRSSGNAAWDTAALHAVQRSDPMPLDASGQTPREFVIVLRSAG
ncbi:hypothetical protein R69927_05310 [Paraburkholderia domus]|jgi:TonB family C-terminal domain|uniref:TonB C-terminal domain-containing protein n=1 Tax=Paraburkholderia domus TaxID=2793075 RepID=A0A9N8N4P0_9BURK|nr:TonB family protein [Paraburkholderia domus]CAE6813831.1 hypothetical protein R75483_05919 [Paraburkholderia domus]CAE6815226.1 hypothetical protein R70006_05946 [Paraburkholderia domus]CAE6868686.1 hypothetical protein R69749_05994 [Paraburkholderia domus]CAE6899627.1 hypothetical protein R69927_05310 [Paraburkholderia domus]CAE6944125.1 hypothetical protein R70199_06238 [Paraburkholderia domus]